MTASAEDDHNSTTPVEPFSMQLQRHLSVGLSTTDSRSPKTERELISLAKPDHHHATFNQPYRSLGGTLDFPPEPLPTRKRKREFTETTGTMVADLRVNVKVASLETTTITPTLQKPQHDLPLSTNESNHNGRNPWRQYTGMSIPSPRTSGSPVVDKLLDESTKDEERQNIKKDSPKKRGRQGSLLEWRNKERFEEPLRL